MADLSRRQFLTKASAGVAASVAAASGLAAVPALLAPAVADASAVGPGAGREPEPDLTGVGQDVVAYVTNESKGEVTVLVGTQEVVAHDRQLVGRLLRAARGAIQEA
jgi:anaerobic selenocysteine-containing dehydrogenase